MADPLQPTSAGKKRKSRGSQGQINLIGRLDETLQESAEHQAVIVELRKQRDSEFTRANALSEEVAQLKERTKQRDMETARADALSEEVVRLKERVKQHEEGGKISAGGIEALKHMNYILSHATKDTITDLSGHVKSSMLLSAHHEMKELILARILEIELDVQHLEKTIDMVIAGHY
ncbi:hypothetical protein UCRNP2_9309 [Neofusicoccum parvum UCRNP2]|uniref:Uncharacterized protein n=1 Tax=Botryosphaeria parva (strain UCR-NP2) TaxID=1287680 RepID=R1G7B1_BOTPV|nr:hypothetical protein UCRNP2_9309 [Neofusicoccum parvum UCRNP2]